MDTAKPAYRGSRSYDKELILNEVIAVCFHYLGPGRRQGMRFVWRCPECGKDEKFAAHATKNICGCLNAGCEMPQTMNSLAFIGNRENLELSGRSFVRVLERGYDILNLEHPSRSTSRANRSHDASQGADVSTQPRHDSNSGPAPETSPSFSPGSNATRHPGKGDQTKPTSQFTRAKAAPPPSDTYSPSEADQPVSYQGSPEDGEYIDEYEVIIEEDEDSEFDTALKDSVDEDAVIVVEASDSAEAGDTDPYEITDGAEPQPTTPGRRLRAETLQAHRTYETGLRGDAEAFAFYEEPDYTIDEELLDAVYTEILEHCSLIDSHREYLKTRGVSAMTAHRARIGSITSSRSRSLKNHLLEKFSEDDLLRVPGFSRRRLGRLSFTLSGEFLLIPYHDADHNITTIEGRVIGKPQKGKNKYVSLRGSGSHLYVFPEFMPDHLEAFCEGVLGAIVSAQSGIAIGSIQGVRRHRDPQTRGSLQELVGADFSGRRLPYIPDVDVKPAAIADVKAEIPKACRNLIAAHNGVPQIALLPEGKDLDEWMLKRKATERRPAFTSFVAGAVSLERYLQATDDATGQAPQEQPAELSTSDETTGRRFDQAPEQDVRQTDPPKHLANPSTPGPLYEPQSPPEEDSTPQPSARTTDHHPSPALPASSDGTPSQAKVFGALVRMSSLRKRDIDLMNRFGIPEQIAREAGIGSMSKVRAEDIAGKLTKSMGPEALVALDGFGAGANGRVELDMTGDYCLIPYRDAHGNITAIQAIPVSEDSKGPCVDQERKTLIRGLPGDHLYVPAGQPEKLEVITTSVVEALRLAACGIRAASIRKIGAYSPAAGEQVMAELSGVNFGGRRILYAPLLGNPPRRNVINDAPQAMRALIVRQNGTPALLQDQPEGQPLGEYLLSRAAWERREKFELLLSGAETFNQLLPRDSQRPHDGSGAGPDGGQTLGGEPQSRARPANSTELADTGTITAQDTSADMPAPPIPVPGPGYRAPSPPRPKDRPHFTQEEVMSGLAAALLCILVPLAALTLWHLPAGLLSSLHAVLGDPIRDRTVENVPLALTIIGACLQAIGQAISAAWVTAIFYGSAIAFVVAPYVVYRRRSRRVDLLMILGVIPPTKRYLRRFGRN
jgi:hypothetical protein